MSTGSSQSSDALAPVDEVLSDPKLLDEPRAVLLLQLCRFAQIFRPEVVERYWQQLRKVSASLPLDHREALEGLQAAVEPRPAKSLHGFAAEIVTKVDNAVRVADAAPDKACRMFQDCEQRLRKRWWPFGKAPAWLALVQAWAELDREAALKLIGKVPRGVQQNLLQRLNEASPLTRAEWDLAHKHGGMFGGIIPVLLEMLDTENPTLRLSPTLAKAVGSNLLPDVNATPLIEEASQQFEAEREKALDRYLNLVECMVETFPHVAESLMGSVFMATAQSPRSPEKWPECFTALRRLISVWTSFSALRQSAVAFLDKKAPNYMRDFALSQWYGMIPTSHEEATSTWETLEGMCSDKPASEKWFLVTLVRRGMADIAMKFAGSSVRSEELVPVIRRAWLCEDPQTASSAITPQDLAGDLIGQFLLLGSIEERVKFLRQHTDNGSQSLPEEMWSQPNLSLLLSDDDPESIRLLTGASEKPPHDALLRLYKEKAPNDNQFREYVRLHGYRQYGYEDLDPYLLATLVAWDDQHPDEVRSVMRSMWTVMEPDDIILTQDGLRNAIFERCQTVFAARPTALDELFVKWVKRKLVDDTMTQHTGDATYTFSLNKIVPFLYCLLSAEKVAVVSPQRCDEILACAISDYTADEDFMTFAAKLYASDKGLSALQPPAPLMDSAHLKPWQLGVVEASSRSLLRLFVEDHQEAEADAEE